MSTERHVCIHGHWYQPPRENPFTGLVEDQPSAAPYRNWNERITAESYAPNAAAEILDDQGEVRARVNNYSLISSDWGPTLLAWLERHEPDTYRAILEGDRLSIELFDGHSGTMAHTYNHTILPLSSQRDKRTQVLWGIADYVHRFGRPPVGMWLPETAVDLESLQLLAGSGIAFTVLAPGQAAAVLRDGEWNDVGDGSVDTTMPYAVDLPDGNRISVFFYNGPLSREIAFDGILEDGARLAERLVTAIDTRDGAALSHVATDGETYGHHHRHGEMALARALEILSNHPDVQLTNYARYLAGHPPSTAARIVEESSWSCAHGVERWRADCGCHTGAHPEWNQQWRATLRRALDGLRDELAADFEDAANGVLADPWEARDRYIEVLLGGPVPAFLDRHVAPGADDQVRAKALDLLEIQHRAMLMFTSCGWFFDDISGLESVFVIRQAARAIELARSTLGRDHEPAFLESLAEARSNVDGRTGREIYADAVGPHLRSR